MSNTKLTKERVFAVLKSIPRGKVTTYGHIAAALGHPRAARAIGGILHTNTDPISYPCHRVVNRNGRLAPGYVFGGPDEQRFRLECEGVEVTDNHVDPERFLFIPSPVSDDEGTSSEE